MPNNKRTQASIRTPCYSGVDFRFFVSRNSLPDSFTIFQLGSTVIKNQGQVRLNLGCGSNFHPDWLNLDLVPASEDVIQTDLTSGIPYEDSSADVIYHSHVLEHLTEPKAIDFLVDCFRVLKPGGILRIAVPDLEQIATQYLQTLNSAWQDPDQKKLANHRWMQLEILDQLVRTESGGAMGKFMTDTRVPNPDFIRQRLGEEVSLASETRTSGRPRTGWWTRLKKKTLRKLIRLLGGKQMIQQLDLVTFRDSGEIHQWMYDRVSLRTMLTKIGFGNFQIQQAETSDIPDFCSYQLDAQDGKTRKPDSLFVEATKPNQVATKAA